MGSCVVELYKPDEPLGEVSQSVIIDWPDARRSDPAADLCRSYLFMKLRAAEIATTYRDAYCRAADMPRQAVLSWLPYVAAADVPGELDDLLKIVDVLARPSPHPITVSPRAMRWQFTLLASTGMKLKRRLRVD